MNAARSLFLTCILAAALHPQTALAKPASHAGEPIRQIELSEEKIAQYLAVRPELDAILLKAAVAPEPHYMRALNETARKNGFADYADYESTAIDIIWILTGIDPLSRKYVGVQAVTKQEAALLLSDKALSAHDHKSRLDALHAQMLTANAPKFAANVTLVTKYYDKLLTDGVARN